jgi:hypothetical protein
LDVERREDLLCQMPQHESIHRSVPDLRQREVRGAPVAGLFRLVERKAQISLDGGLQARGVLALEEADGLERAVHLARLDASLLQKGKLEGGIVGNEAEAVEELEDLWSRPAQVNTTTLSPPA